jgi:tRNA-dihydrouridine synthase 1
MTKYEFMDFLNTLERPWKFLAPMVGNSERPYRTLARKYGADVCYTEMVHCRAFNRNRCDPQNNQWYTAGDRPLVIQICGDDPDEMVKTCLKIEKYCDAIDINFGCPQDIAKKGHYGSFLQDEWILIEKIVKACSSAIKIPLFCKIRIFESVEKTVEYAKLFENSGASLLAVHGRLREQKGANTGLASWDHIKAVKNSVSIPVISNGNLIYLENIQECFEYTGADGVMIAEPHLYNPCIFIEKQKNSLEIFEDFLEIIKKDTPNEKNVFFGGLKSHVFKILNTIFVKLPGLRASLDKSKNLSDYFNFLDLLKSLVKDQILNENDLQMLPNIRKTIESEESALLLKHPIVL